MRQVFKIHHQKIYKMFSVIFVLFFSAVIIDQSYEDIPNKYFEANDDGIITLSHAKNLVEYGHIGVSPSGEIVEGFSTPLHFILLTITYALFPDADYITISWFFAYLSLVGIIFFLLFAIGSINFCSSILTLIFVLGLSTSTSFLEWQGGGMENPIFNFFYLATAIILSKTVVDKKIRAWRIAIVCLAMLARLDSIYYVLPLVLVFIFLSYYFETSEKNIFSRRVLLYILFPLSTFLILHIFRYYYFGGLKPHIATARDIDIFSRINSILQFKPSYFASQLRIGYEILKENNYWLICFSFIPLFFKPYKNPNFRKKCLTFNIHALILIVQVLLSPMFFGTAALDFRRLGTFLNPVIVTSLILSSYLIYDNFPKSMVTKLLSVGIAFFAILWAKTFQGDPYHICCRAIHSQSDQARQWNMDFQIDRPLLAVPDLGANSLSKSFNILDYGWLGSKIMANFKNSHFESKLIFFEMFKPDFIFFHGAWACIYSFIQNDPRFIREYKPIKVYKNARLERQCNNKLLEGTWVRKEILPLSNSPERLLLNKLKISKNISTIEQAVRRCGTWKKDGRCHYIILTIYRIKPEFDKMIFDKIIPLLEKFKYPAWSINWLKSNRLVSWDKPIIDYITQRSNTPIFFGAKTTTAADINGDSFADLVAVNDSEIIVKYGYGTNFFDPPITLRSITFQGTIATTFGDINGDGWADVIAIDETETKARFNLRDGSFGPPIVIQDSPFYGTKATTFADLNGDGYDDFIMVNNNETIVKYNNYPNGFGPKIKILNDSYYGTQATTFADINNDGYDDFVVVNNNKTVVKYNNHQGSFDNNAIILTTPFYGTIATNFADFNGDGYDDIFVVNQHQVVVKYNNRNAGFGKHTSQNLVN